MPGGRSRVLGNGSQLRDPLVTGALALRGALDPEPWARDRNVDFSICHPSGPADQGPTTA